MILEDWKQIKENKDVRQNLSKLRQQVKDKEALEILDSLLEGNEQILTDLLQSEDAKTRKNAALLLGDLGRQEFLVPVYEAYRREEQRFVKSAYITAIGNFDYEAYLPELKESLKVLGGTAVTVENQKHLTEEMHELSSLIVRAEGVKTHCFTGRNKPHDILLLTNRNFAELTREELTALEPHAQTEIFGAGVRARVGSLNWTEEIRTYQELLFVVKGMKTAPMEAVQAAETIAGSELLSWLRSNHEGEAPYYFRVEMKSKRPLDEKSAFVKKLSGQIERLTERALINDAANYEVEIRVIENKEGNCNLLVKLFTIKDERFLYRQEVIPTSIKPVNAALTAALARDYMKEGAQVLDPFCGVGTMLVERFKAVRAYSTYGIDIQEDAIDKARNNTEAAGQIVHYINRDFFSFEHEYLFDEVITNMPFQIGRITEDEVTETYRRFFKKISKHLKEKAVLILYSHNKELVERLASGNGFRILKKYEISRKEGTYVFVLQR